MRVIDADGSQLGVIPTKDAQKIALEKNLDLVKIAPQATPPVCRIMDYGKYRFEQAKKEKEAKKNLISRPPSEQDGGLFLYEEKPPLWCFP